MYISQSFNLQIIHNLGGAILYIFWLVLNTIDTSVCLYMYLCHWCVSVLTTLVCICTSVLMPLVCICTYDSVVYLLSEF